MDCARADKIIILIARVIFQHAVQVRDVLEIVGVNVMPRQRRVWQNVVLEWFNLQIDPLLRQNRLSLLQNFRVRGVGPPTVSVSAQEAKLRALRVAAAISVSVFFMMWFLCVFISVYLTVK